MQSPYFVMVDTSLTSLTKARMFFGRRQELTTILNHLLNGDSILLNGERRIGKTFLLTMMRHRAVAQESNLLETMLDRQTASALASFYAATSAFRWIYIDASVVQDVAGFYHRVLSGLGEGLGADYVAHYPIDGGTFIGELTALARRALHGNQRAVVLVDEAEKLIELSKAVPVLAYLRAALQECGNVHFVLAGDIRPHQETPEFSRLRGTLQAVQLAPLCTPDAEALVWLPLSNALSFEEKALARIRELTGGKPYLIQILCGRLCDLTTADGAGQVRVTQAAFDQLWDSDLREWVFDSFRLPLSEFFEGLQGDERAVFVFLAHHPLVSAQELADGLRIDVVRVRKAARFLLATHRIVGESSGYRLAAAIVQEFGVQNVACPSARPTRGVVQRQSLESLLRGESVSVEYKSSLRWDVKEGKENRDLERMVTKTVAGFLNSEGGTLVIGVADSLEVVGIEPDLALLSKRSVDQFELLLRQLIANAVGTEFSQLQQIFFESHKGKTVCIVHVEPSPRPVFLTDRKGAKEFYIRDGNSTKALDLESATSYIGIHWPR